MGKQATSCPNKSTTWLVYDDENEKWSKADSKFSVECVSDPTPKWADWAAWSTCSSKCRKTASSELGVQKRSRQCKNGTTCPGKNTEEQECGTDMCEWSAWSTWTSELECQFCNVKDANQTRTRSCSEEGYCDGSTTETQACDNTCPESSCCEKVIIIPTWPHAPGS